MCIVLPGVARDVGGRIILKQIVGKQKLNKQSGTTDKG